MRIVELFGRALLLFMIGLVIGFALRTANAAEPRFKIVIIDTGYDDTKATAALKLCPTGHYDFYQQKATIGSYGLHGTYVASVIAERLKNVDYCAVVFQVASPTGIKYRDILWALRKSLDQNATVINISIVGNGHSFIEREILVDAVKGGARVFTGAGNENQNLDTVCNVYPGCYRIRGVYSVGALSPDGTQKALYSNYGSKVDLWYPGHYETFDGGTAQGTSFASPAALADYVLLLSQRK